MQSWISVFRSQYARLQSNQLDYPTSHRIKANSIKRQYNRPRAERRINEHTTELENFPSLLFAENPPRTGIDGPTNNLTAGYTAWWIYPPTCRIIRRELVNKLAGYKRGGAYYCADSTHSRGRANISSIEGGRRKRRQDRTMIPLPFIQFVEADSIHRSLGLDSIHTQVTLHKSFVAEVRGKSKLVIRTKRTGARLNTGKLMIGEANPAPYPTRLARLTRRLINRLYNTAERKMAATLDDFIIIPRPIRLDK